MKIVWEKTIDGYHAFNDTLKVAVLSTKHNKGLAREGVVQFEALKEHEWGIHFTAPAMSVALISAIISSLPTEA